MPTSTKSLYKGQLITVAKALRLRESLDFVQTDEAFACAECGNFVRPHQAGGGVAAHFEHLKRNPACSLSHRVPNSDKNPGWVQDELILALDVYLKSRPIPPGKTSKEIRELSETLRKLALQLFPGYSPSATFRNPNGVYMKLMNFRRFDPTYTVGGKKGLARGSKDEESVWTEFSSDPARCHQVAQAIIAGLKKPSTPRLDGLGGVVEAPEGRLLTRQHVVRERDQKLVIAKRSDALGRHGKLTCEVCGFDFFAKYGERGQGYIECHHTKPLATLVEGHKTHIKDLALVCSNCHRMIHHRKQWLSIEELRANLKE